MKKLIGLLFLLFMATFVFSQKNERPLVQFTGIIHNADSAYVVVPYVRIVNNSDKNFVNLSNYKGYFSFVAHEQDTVRFSCVGYAGVTIIIPANVPNNSYTVQVLLKPQIPNLPAYKAFPWATEEEFTREFLSVKIADDDLENAKKNLSNAKISALERTLPRDGLESGTSFQDFHNGVLNSHSITNPLLNPFNWGSLIKEIEEGDRSRSLDNNNNTSNATTTATPASSN
jgi:hypothetical protein